jgi:hypothetical protein
MEGFKANPKMKCDLPCYKEGGFVKRDKAKHSESTEVKKDVAKDKKIVKKAFKIHDEQSHDEKTDLSKLKKGGRAKKEVGTVKKYKTGGAVKKMAAGGMGAQTDAELAMAKAAAAPTPPAMAPRKRRRPMTAAGTAGMGAAPGLVGQLGMGAAGTAGMDAMPSQPLGDMPQPPMAGMGSMSDDERMNMMRGLQAVGQYAYGGKVC